MFVRKQLGDRVLEDLCNVFDGSHYSVLLTLDQWRIGLVAGGLCKWQTVIASLVVLASWLSGCWSNFKETGGEVREDNR